jgi:hypothetical protein
VVLTVTPVSLRPSLLRLTLNLALIIQSLSWNFYFFNLTYPVRCFRVPQVEDHCPRQRKTRRTNSMDLSVPSEAASCAATQKLLSILWSPKVHYHVHKGSPLATYPEPDQFSPHHPHSISHKILLNIILPPTSWSCWCSLPLLAVPPISYMYSSSPPFVLHVLRMSSSLTSLF